MEQKNYSLLSHNTFGIDVKADRFIEYSSPSELEQLIKAGAFKGKYLHIGEGSNLLFTKDFDGTVFHSKINGIEFIEQADQRYAFLRVGAGVKWDDFVEYCVQHEYYGTENLSLIPGEVGAAAVQNIGAYGTEIKDIMTGLMAYNTENGNLTYISNNFMEYDYRYSMLKRPENKKYIVISVYFALSTSKEFNLSYKALANELEARGGEMTLRYVRDTIIDIRRNKLPEPSEIGSAGSFFMNPIVGAEVFKRVQAEYPKMPFFQLSDDSYKIPAGWLIDQCGWKGKSLGHAGVYEKQALVLVNRGGATGSEVVALSDTIIKSVKEKFGPEFELHPEVNIF